MRRATLSIGLMLLTFLSAVAQDRLDTLKVGSTIYSNVVIVAVNATDIYFSHSSGVANIKLRHLEPELQQRFHYDPEIAARAAREQRASEIRYQRLAMQTAWSVTTQIREREVTEQIVAKEAAFSIVDPASPSSPINKPAPPVSVQKWYSADKPPALKGKFILVYFWATTSDPCHQTTPTLNALHKNFSDKLTVIGISSEGESAFKETPDPTIDFYYGSDTQGSMSRAFGITSIPSVALIDPKGLLRYQGHPAAITEDSLARAFKRFSE